LDINLLTTDFPAALADALDRTLLVSVLAGVAGIDDIDAHPSLLRTRVG